MHKIPTYIAQFRMEAFTQSSKSLLNFREFAEPEERGILPKQ
jgi:hypothetical protein